LPLGQAHGADALNVWEHVALAQWLSNHELPGEVGLEHAAQRSFEAECAHWESLVFSGPLEDTLLLDSTALDDDVTDAYESEVSEDWD